MVKLTNGIVMQWKDVFNREMTDHQQTVNNKKKDYYTLAQPYSVSYQYNCNNNSCCCFGYTGVSAIHKNKK